MFFFYLIHFLCSLCSPLFIAFALLPSLAFSKVQSNKYKKKEMVSFFFYTFFNKIPWNAFKVGGRTELCKNVSCWMFDTAIFNIPNEGNLGSPNGTADRSPYCDLSEANPKFLDSSSVNLSHPIILSTSSINWTTF